MICSICNKRFIANDLIIRAVSCRILDVAFEEIEYVGDSEVLNMHIACFEHRGEEKSVEVVGVETGVVRTNALECFV